MSEFTPEELRARRRERLGNRRRTGRVPRPPKAKVVSRRIPNKRTPDGRTRVERQTGRPVGRPRIYGPPAPRVLKGGQLNGAKLIRAQRWAIMLELGISATEVARLFGIFRTDPRSGSTYPRGDVVLRTVKSLKGYS